MPDTDERVIGDVVVRIDRSVCVGFGHCMDESPEAFLLEEDNIVAFHEPEHVDRALLVAACEACPVGALSVLTTSGEQLV